MAYTSWRGSVGLVKPEVSAGQFEEFVRLLPDGIGAIQLFMDLPKERGPARFEAALKQLDQKIGDLAESGVDVVVTEGSAVFMRDGVKAEAKLVRGWEKKHKVQVAPTGQTIVNAMKAMGFKRVIGVRPSTWKTGADFTGRYFEGAGFDVLTIASPEGHDYTSVLQITSHEVYQTVKKAFLAHPGADGIFIMAAIMSSTDMLQTIEDDLGVPVVSAVTARLWEVQRRLHVRQPVAGYGRLLREMP